ncbi:hypothetical protein HYY75_00580 [bacterium]|nr:hypothetical protein [bacterium]
MPSKIKIRRDYKTHQTKGVLEAFASLLNSPRFPASYRRKAGIQVFGFWIPALETVEKYPFSLYSCT